MDPVLLKELQKTCSKGDDSKTFLDQKTPFLFDNQFYKEIMLKRGILEIDQNLADDESTAGIVSSFGSNGGGFKRSFGIAMVKMGNLGEVRRNCRDFNK